MLCKLKLMNLLLGLCCALCALMPSTVLAQGGANASEKAKIVYYTPLEEEEVTQLIKTYRQGGKYLAQYAPVDTVEQVVLVEQDKKKPEQAQLYLMVKDRSHRWQQELKTKAYLGKYGLGKTCAGDAKTPVGDYGIVLACGLPKAPRTALPYAHLTEYMCICADRENYNQFLDLSRIDHLCSTASLKLTKDKKSYKYAIFLDYNKEGDPAMGGCIFIECFGRHDYTRGSIAVSESVVKHLIRTLSPTARICIYARK